MQNTSQEQTCTIGCNGVPCARSHNPVIELASHDLRDVDGEDAHGRLPFPALASGRHRVGRQPKCASLRCVQMSGVHTGAKEFFSGCKALAHQTSVETYKLNTFVVNTSFLGALSIA